MPPPLSTIFCGTGILLSVWCVNQKTAGVLVGTARWKVGYRLLSSIIEGGLFSGFA
jgi:hypothetical protein